MKLASKGQAKACFGTGVQKCDRPFFAKPGEQCANDIRTLYEQTHTEGLL
jgi:hypothetical protein